MDATRVASVLCVVALAAACGSSSSQAPLADASAAPPGEGAPPPAPPGAGDASADGATDSGDDGSTTNGQCGGSRQTCCASDGCSPGLVCYGEIYFQGQHYQHQCWTCTSCGGDPTCACCGGKGQPCCVTEGAHQVCRTGFTCSTDVSPQAGTCN
jgi:hypothetical protein